MSHVTDIIIVSALDEGAAFHYLDDALCDIAYSAYPAVSKGAIKSIRKHGGGSKAHQCEIWSGAINYLDIPLFLECIPAAPWREPLRVQAFVKDEHEESFSMYVVPSPGHLVKVYDGIKE